MAKEPQPHAPAEAQPEHAPARWHPGRRVVLTFLGAVLILVAILALAMSYFIRHTTIVTSTQGGNRVESPAGALTTGNDPAQLAKSLGIDLFPGAVGEHSAQAQLPSNTMASMQFHTAASPRQVISFYHERYPDATVKPLSNGGFSLVQLNGLDTLTVEATRENHLTHIAINDIRR